MSRGRYPRRPTIPAPHPETEARYLLRWRSGDLYHHPERFPALDSASLFGNRRPLQLEIGCGTGEFLCALAAEEPEVNFLGVDVALKPLHRAVNLAAEGSLDNIRFIRADIKRLSPLLRADSLQMVYLHFPIRIKKTRHRKRKIFTADFLDRIHAALVPNGRISVMTDQPDLFNEMTGLVQSDGRFEFVTEHQRRIRPAAESPSATQRIWEARGLTTRHFEIEKRAIG